MAHERIIHHQLEQIRLLAVSVCHSTTLVMLIEQDWIKIKGTVCSRKSHRVHLQFIFTSIYQSTNTLEVINPA
jgi:hypothetical protein